MTALNAAINFNSGASVLSTMRPGGTATGNVKEATVTENVTRHPKRVLDKESIMYRHLESKKRLKAAKQRDNTLLERRDMEPFDSVSDIVKFATAFHVYDDPVAGEGDSDNCLQADAAFEKVSQKLVDRCDRFCKLHRASLFRVALSNDTNTQKTLIDKLRSSCEQESLKEGAALLSSKQSELSKRKAEERKRVAQEKSNSSLSTNSTAGNASGAAVGSEGKVDGGNEDGGTSHSEHDPYAQITAGANPLLGMMGSGGSTAGTISMSDVAGTSSSLLL
eukprot:m.193170 g.193170  ORF g.193170 m.193170 type:complete len:278 (+) comp18622_c0_seq1:190-1023(+)